MGVRVSDQITYDHPGVSTKLCFSVADSTHERLIAEAERLGIKVASMIRRLVIEGLERLDGGR